MFQPPGRDAELLRVRALTDVNLDRHITGRFGANAEPRAGNLFYVSLKFLGCKPSRALRLFIDDDLRTRLAVFDDDKLCAHVKFNE